VTAFVSSTDDIRFGSVQVSGDTLPKLVAERA